VAEVARRHPEVLKARLVVTGRMADDRMALKAEVQRPLAGSDDALVRALEDTVRDITKLRGSVELCDAGSLPNDGKVIEDARAYD